MRKTVVRPENRKSKKSPMDFKPKRSKAKNGNIGLGAQPVRLKDCNYTLSSNGTELVKLRFKHLTTDVMETFSLINESVALDAIMDVLDNTGKIDVDFRDYIGSRMNIEIVESGKFRNIINAWTITHKEYDQAENTDEEDLNTEDEIDIADLLSGSND